MMMGWKIQMYFSCSVSCWISMSCSICLPCFGKLPGISDHAYRFLNVFSSFWVPESFRVLPSTDSTTSACRKNAGPLSKGLLPWAFEVPVLFILHWYLGSKPLFTILGHSLPNPSSEAQLPQVRATPLKKASDWGRPPFVWLRPGPWTWMRTDSI